MTSNVTMTRKGDLLTLTIDLSKSYGPSASGKTTIIASSEGNATIEGGGTGEHPDMKLGLNIFAKKRG